jgi:hypothetical protein
MPRYGVMFTATASHVEKVEADSPEDARERAREQAYVTLCHECAHKVDLGDFEDDEDDEGGAFLL